MATRRPRPGDRPRVHPGPRPGRLADRRASAEARMQERSSAQLLPGPTPVQAVRHRRAAHAAEPEQLPQIRASAVFL